MYLSYFGLDSQPFSIVPDHRAFYMGQSHRDAVAHLLYALNESGGFVQLTGEVGTGKTTVSRYILANLPDDVDVALLLNPRITEREMLESICDELGVEYDADTSQKALVTRLNDYLLRAHGDGRKTVLIIDEAQNLSREVLEQIRLLTNLETSTDKLLQIILIGQPELAQTLNRHDLRQLSQRIVGRFRLDPLNRTETREYIEYRLKNCGVERPLFTRSAISRIHQLSQGIPRIINVLCDRALTGAYAQSREKVTPRIVNIAAKEVLGDLPPGRGARLRKWLKVAVVVLAVPVIGWLVMEKIDIAPKTEAPTEVSLQQLEPEPPVGQVEPAELPVDGGSSAQVEPDSDEVVVALEVDTASGANSMPADQGSAADAAGGDSGPVTSGEDAQTTAPPQSGEDGSIIQRYDLKPRLGVPLDSG